MHLKKHREINRDVVHFDQSKHGGEVKLKIYKMMDGCVTKNKAKFTDNNIKLPDGVVVLCCFKRIGYSR